jgi:hypothetical protein
MGGFCRFRRSSIEDVPPACEGQKEKRGDGGDERHGTRAPLGRHDLRLIGCRCRNRRLCLHRLADFERVDVGRLGDVLAAWRLCLCASQVVSQRHGCII